MLPDRIVFSYQGDGDLASIGMAEIVHCANRGEKVTVIFVNNAIYGMTGGQMAPTTMPGQVTTTSPHGRQVETAGPPIRVSEMLATLDGAAYVADVGALNPGNWNLRLAAVAPDGTPAGELGIPFVWINRYGEPNLTDVEPLAVFPDLQ